MIYTALPHLSHNRSLRFCLLPEGMDPDDLIAQRGADAMKSLVDNSMPLHQMLWLSETRGRQVNSPEKRAGLQAKLNAAIEKIPDGNLRKQYFSEFKSMMWKAFGNPQNRTQRKIGGADSDGMPLNETKSSQLAQIAAKRGSNESVRVAVILGICLNYPSLIAEFEGQLEELVPSIDDYAEILGMVLKRADISDPAEFKSSVASGAGEKKVERLLSQRNLAILPAIANPGCLEQARTVLEEEIRKLFADRSAREALREARMDIETDAKFAMSCIKGARADLRNARSISRAGLESELQAAPVDEEDRKNIDDILARI